MKKNDADDIFIDFYRYLPTEYYDGFLNIPDIPVEEGKFKSIIDHCYLPILKKLWEKLLILEMNFSDKEGLLQGETADERFSFFVREICKKENLNALYKKYPALQEIWLQDSTIFSSSLHIFFKHIATDIAEVVRCFYGCDKDILISDINMLGDPHRSMRQTARIKCTDGDGFEYIIYYKPRNMEIDEGFYSFIDWFNKNSSITHIAPRVLLKDGYGWAEAIDHKDCETVEQVQNYYRRYGSLIALTYLFAATDLHMENIVAHGQYPVIVDLETLFSCTLATEKHLPAKDHLYTSLLLPTEVMYDDLEISPLSARSHTVTNIDILVNPQRKSSSLRMEKQKFTTGDYASQLMLNGEAIDFLDYEADILNGMRETLGFLYRNRQPVIMKINDIMRHAPVRIVRQATEEYSKILYNCRHPNSLIKNNSDQELYLLSDPSRDIAIIKSEIAELRQGDIPYFYMPFNGSDLCNGTGQRLDVEIYQSPAEKCEGRFAKLTPGYVEQIIEDARFAFLVYRAKKGRACLKTGQNFAAFANLSDHHFWDALAKSTLTTIMERALHSGEKVYWRNIHVTGKNMRADVSGTDLYQGASGIALAFHLAGQRLSCRPFTDFAERLALQITEQLREAPAAELGAFSGTAGTLWSLSVIKNACLPDMLPVMDRELAKIAYKLLNENINQYSRIDFIGGIAGTLVMLLRLHRLYYDYPLAQQISKLAGAAFLLLKINAKALLDEEKTLLGFAHGTAGVSAALAQYMTCFRIKDDEAVEIIRHHTCREAAYRTAKGWPRLGSDDHCSTSWCHGTAGIGYSRLFIEPYIPAQIYAADMAVVRQRLGEIRQSLCLCHGMMADYCLAPAFGVDAGAIGNQIRKTIEQEGVITDLGLNDFEIVGAMTGVAGLFAGQALLLDKF